MTLTQQREQLLMLKKSLMESLGEMWSDYWQNLHQFLHHQISKTQLDTHLLFLTPTQQKLHNRLILSIISNCMNSELVSVGEIQSFAGKSRESDCKHFQTRFNTRILSTMTIEEKQRLLSLESEVREEIVDDVDLGVEGIPKSCVEERDLPTQEQLRSRIKFISSCQGLNPSFGNDVVNMMNDALQVYLKGCIINRHID